MSQSELRNRIAAGKIIAGRDEPYLSSALQALTIHPADGRGVVAVDRWWRLHVDSEVGGEWTAEQWSCVLRAESRRLLLDHPQRSQMLLSGEDEALTPAVVNLASDAVVYSDTQRSAPCDWPFTAPLSEDYAGGRPGTPLELMADLLALQEPDGSGEDPHGSGANGSRQEWEPDPGNDDTAIGPAAQAVIGETVARAADEWALSHELSPGIAAWVEQTLRPQLDWRRVLASQIRSMLAKAAGKRDYTYSVPSRRTPVGTGVIMPGMTGAEPPRVAVVRDTSGSMQFGGRDLVAEATAEVCGMLTSRARVDIIDVDSQARDPRHVRNANQVAEYHGGGGTDMGLGLERVARMRPKPHLCVVLTDGLTPWPQTRPTRGVPVLVCLLGAQGQRALDEVPSWAHAIVIDDADVAVAASR